MVKRKDDKVRLYALATIYHDPGTRTWIKLTWIKLTWMSIRETGFASSHHSRLEVWFPPGLDLDEEQDLAANVLLFSGLLGKVTGTSIAPLRVNSLPQAS